MMRKFSVVISFQNPPPTPPVIIDLKFFLAQAYRQTLEGLEERQTVTFLSDGALIHIGANEGCHTY